MVNFQGKVAIITGGASGIGRAIGQQLSKLGAIVVLADINAKLAKETAENIIKNGGKAQPATVDVSDAAAVQRLVDNTVAEHGRLDYMFNNAGVVLFGEVRDMTLDQWRRIVDVNLYGTIYGVAASYPRMIEQGFGHIVNTASLAGLAPLPVAVAYSSTKHAVVGLTTSLRAEAADLGVKASVVCPGLIDTPIKDTLTSLDFDKQKAIDGMPIKFRSADYCAKVVIDGVARNKPIITVTFSAKILWLLYRFSPSLALWIAKLSMRDVRKKFITATR